MPDNSYIVIAGGIVDDNNIIEYIRSNSISTCHIVAADKGLETASRIYNNIEYVVGDFDSVDSEVIAGYRSKNSNTRQYNPEKDMTDTQTAIEYCISKKANRIIIFGATGNRLDHFFGNIAMLELAYENNVQAEIIDIKNRITITDTTVSIERCKQYGKYVSVIPYGGEAIVNLKGMKYPLYEHTLYMNESLGISNEINEDKGIIECLKGRVLIIESLD